MSKSQNQFNKKQKEKKRLEKRQDKQQRKEDRKANASNGNELESMMAYVDENGNIVDTPPEKKPNAKGIDASMIEVSTPKKVEEDVDAERRGTVSFFDRNKGFGFINQDGSQERFFVHHSNLKMAISEGDKVLFIARKGLKGPEADVIKVMR